MRPQDAEPLAVGGGRAHRNACGAVGVVVFGLGGRAVPAPVDPSECGFDLRLAQRGQAGASGPVGRTAARLFSTSPWFWTMLVGQALQQAALDGVHVAPRDQDVGQIAHLVERPRLKCGHELALLDHAGLQSEQSEE